MSERPMDVVSKLEELAAERQGEGDRLRANRPDGTEASDSDFEEGTWRLHEASAYRHAASLVKEAQMRWTKRGEVPTEDGWWWADTAGDWDHAIYLIEVRESGPHGLVGGKWLRVTPDETTRWAGPIPSPVEDSP